MTEPEVPASPPEAALVSQSVTCRVVGRRPPESAVSRSFGAISPIESARHAAQIECMTTLAARRSEVASLVRPRQPDRGHDDPLAGPLPARGDAELRAAVSVRMTQK